jgi:predicted membrane protein
VFLRTTGGRPAVGSEASILWGLLFGAIGLGFFVYGKKQRAIVPLSCGIGLMIFPFFVTNTLLLVAFGVVLAAIPYFVRL